jgi:predicted component of viral defense system (DUF524 family)
MNVYIDPEMKIKSGEKLFENQEYYLDFQGSDSEKIIFEIERSKLKNFITWQKGNRYGVLKITNFIGNIYFWENTYDIKSTKFLCELSGAEQFKEILDDIKNFSKNIVFSYNSPSIAIRQVDYKDFNPTLLAMFNYFKEVILYKDYSSNFQSLIHKVIKNANNKNLIEYKLDRIDKLKKMDSKTINSLVNNSKHYSKINDNQSELLNLPITNFISNTSQDKYFPTKAIMKTNKFSYDTNENRFVKYLIKYIENIAFRLNFLKGVPENIQIEKDKVLSFCKTMLNQPFFKEIKEINSIPMDSTVLQKRSGYRELLTHFIKSRFGIKYFFEKFEKDSLTIGLKPISDLYEYWVFYKIAGAFLGNDNVLEQSVMENEGLLYGTCLKKGPIEVYYNLTESRAKNTSYSVSLRPDITVVIKKGDKHIKIAFDAKYKVQRTSEEAINRYIKAEDIHKMHTYLDAIKHCEFAVAVYPGTEFYFYEKKEGRPINRCIETIEVLKGVGAIPLVPKDEELDRQLRAFVIAVKNKFEIE